MANVRQTIMQSRKTPVRAPLKAKARAMLFSHSVASHPRRNAALAMLGKAMGYQIPRHKRELNIDILGGIGCADHKKRMVRSVDIQARLAANPHVTTIALTIDSPGGNLRQAASIYNALRSHGAFVEATVEGTCASAAIFPLLAADLRQAAVNAEIMIHGSALSPLVDRDERWTAEMHLRAAERLHETDKQMLALMAERTGFSIATIAKELGTEARMSIPRAIKMGFIHCMLGEVTYRNGQPYYFPAE